MPPLQHTSTHTNPTTHILKTRTNTEQALNQTFAWAVFLGNGLMAILAGFFGDFLVEKMDLGRVAPFDAAIVFMLIGGAVMMTTWPENYGDSGSKNLTQQFEKAWHAITTGWWRRVSGAVCRLVEMCAGYSQAIQG